MKNDPIFRILALLLTLVLCLSFAACGKEPEPAADAAVDGKPAETAAQPTQEPEIDEIVLSGETARPSEPAEASSTEPAETEPEQTPEPSATPSPEATHAADGHDAVITVDPLPDGTYNVNLYRDLAIDREGRTYATVGELRFVELDDSVVSALKTGDTVKLPLYSFVIETMEAYDGAGTREILFNDGTERCVYVESTNTWRFLWPSDVAYTYEDGTHVMALAWDAVLTDEYTPLSEGQNVYGVPYDERDRTIGALDCLEDYFNHYYGLEYEQAIIEVKNGEIASVLIAYHP
jgi:hypothetical protein